MMDILITMMMMCACLILISITVVIVSYAYYHCKELLYRNRLDTMACKFLPCVLGGIAGVVIGRLLCKAIGAL